MQIGAMYRNAKIFLFYFYYNNRLSNVISNDRLSVSLEERESTTSDAGLNQSAGNTDHSKTAILQLLGGKLLKLLLTLGADVGRVPTEVSRAAVRVLGLDRSSQHLDGGDGDDDLDDGGGVLGVDLGQGGERVHLVESGVGQDASVKTLNIEAKSGKPK